MNTSQRIVFLVSFLVCIAGGLAMILIGAGITSFGLLMGGTMVIAAGGGSISAAYAATEKKARVVAPVQA